MIALKWHKVQLKMEELSNQVNLSSEDIKVQAVTICKETVEKLLKVKSQTSSKTFFVSLAHHFLERLIHLHSNPIKQLLSALSKEIQAHFQGANQYDNPSLSWQQLFNIKESKSQNLDAMSTIKQLFAHLLGMECKGRTNYQRQNIFLEISCSLNYTCPLCIKKMENFAPKSIKFIKHCSEEIQSAKEPQTMKVISCVEADRSSRMPSLSKPNKFESILQMMKAEREASKKQEQAKQKKQNKVWNLLGQILDLDRQKYTIDHIFKESKNKENNLMKELNQKNVKNQHFISQFSKRMKAHRYELKQNNVTADYFQTYQPPHQSKEKQSSERSVSSKSRRNTIIKKQVKILLPICSNSSRLSSIQPKKTVQLTNQVGNCTYSYLNERPTQNGKTVSKTLHFYRPFKSNRDVCSILSKQKYQPLDLCNQSFNKSLKLV